MKAQKLLRVAHRWVSIIAAPVVLVMIGAGVLLMLKKDIDWIQPPTLRGAASGPAPETSFRAVFEAARAVPEAGIEAWSDLERFDVKADRGVAKLVSASRWEVQVDIETLEVLAVSYRRSDLIEAIHDGSFFASWTKHYVFLPAGIGLFVLWASGVYLFFLPHFKKAATRRSRLRRLADQRQTGRPATGST